MRDRIGIAVIGAGAFGREHLRALSGLEDVAIAGVADTDGARAQSAAEQFGAAEWTADPIRLIEAPHPPDGLIVASPGPSHVAIASQALDRGIPVLVEKPVGMSAAEVETLAAAASDSRGFVLPGHVLRFSDAYRTFVAIAQTQIGRILSVTARRHRDADHAVRYADVDPVLMTMIHDIDLALWITGGTPAAAYALRRPADTSRSETKAILIDARGPIWDLSTAWTFAAEAVPTDRIEVVGEEGGVELEFAVAIRQSGKSERVIDLAGASHDSALAAELQAFADGIRNRRAPREVTLNDAAAGLLAADAVRRSLTTGTVVHL